MGVGGGLRAFSADRRVVAVKTSDIVWGYGFLGSPMQKDRHGRCFQRAQPVLGNRDPRVPYNGPPLMFRATSNSRDLVASPWCNGPENCGSWRIEKTELFVKEGEAFSEEDALLEIEGEGTDLWGVDITIRSMAGVDGKVLRWNVGENTTSDELKDPEFTWFVVQKE
eukprot:COSAG03_NODE_1121_length_4775_cov_3.041702_4_plen_167_part_00